MWRFLCNNRVLCLANRCPSTPVLNAGRLAGLIRALFDCVLIVLRRSGAPPSLTADAGDFAPSLGDASIIERLPNAKASRDWLSVMVQERASFIAFVHGGVAPRVSSPLRPVRADPPGTPATSTFAVNQKVLGSKPVWGAKFLPLRVHPHLWLAACGHVASEMANNRGNWALL